MDLLSYRTEMGLSLEQTARELGLSSTSKGWLSEIENGKKPASIRLALKIQQWSAGKVSAASVCPELAEHAGPPSDGDPADVADAASAVSIEKTGALQ